MPQKSMHDRLGQMHQQMIGGRRHDDEEVIPPRRAEGDAASSMLKRVVMKALTEARPVVHRRRTASVFGKG
jgi:hypothetical protein